MHCRQAVQIRKRHSDGDKRPSVPRRFAADQDPIRKQRSCRSAHRAVRNARIMALAPFLASSREEAPSVSDLTNAGAEHSVCNCAGSHIREVIRGDVSERISCLQKTAYQPLHRAAGIAGSRHPRFGVGQNLFQQNSRHICAGCFVFLSLPSASVVIQSI